MESYYQTLIDAVGQPYLDAERQLIEIGEAAIPFLRQQLAVADPFLRLIAQVVLQWIENGDVFQACLEYFDAAEQRARETAIGLPPPAGVANYLTNNFGDTVLPLLGVYVVKLETLWPSWKIAGALLYFVQVGTEASDALIKFITVTPNVEFRELAIASLVSVADDSVLEKVIQFNLVDLDETTQRILHQVENQIRAKLESGI